jgi:hypothetical protein
MFHFCSRALHIRFKQQAALRGYLQTAPSRKVVNMVERKTDAEKCKHYITTFTCTAPTKEEQKTSQKCQD